MIFSITCDSCHVDDLFNDSFRDSLHWNAANNFNDLLHHAILHALPWDDLHNFHDFLLATVGRTRASSLNRSTHTGMSSSCNGTVSDTENMITRLIQIRSFMMMFFALIIMLQDRKPSSSVTFTSTELSFQVPPTKN